MVMKRTPSACCTVWMVDVVGQDLEGDLAVQGRVEGLPDHAHAAFADLFDQAVVEELLTGGDRQVVGPRR
jgi:hypothetical protein